MPIVNFRTDDLTQQALEELTADGATVSAVIRQALLDAARQRRRDLMRRESTTLLNDPTDLVESRAVLRDVDDLRAW